MIAGSGTDEYLEKLRNMIEKDNIENVNFLGYIENREEFFNNIKESFKEATLEFETINIKIDSTEWIDVHKKLRDEFNLKFFSWLSAIDWDNEVSVGEAPKESVSPSFEIITCLSDVGNTNLVTVSTSISKSEPNINSLIDVYAGAN